MSKLSEVKPDPVSFQKEIEELHKRLGTPNTEDAIYSAARIVNRLLNYKDQGYQIALAKNDHIHAPEAPRRPHIPIEQWIKHTLHSSPH